MKKLLSISVAIAIFAFIAWANPAIAADLEVGARVFRAKCIACHMGGNNTVKPTKTLKQDALTANGKDTVAAIVAQVTYGNGAMPALGSRLSTSEIEEVATYVLKQAAAGWPRR